MLLILITLGLYAPVGRFDFVDYDDDKYVTDNPHVQEFTRENLQWALTAHHMGLWHPLTWLSHMVDVQLYGLKPGGHHLTSLLLHTANTLLLFGVLRRITGALWRSAVVAALFAWHPLHIESVAWVAERKDVLSCFFGLLAVWTYARYAEQPSAGRLGWVAVLFALTLMSKPMLVTLPFALLLLDYWPLQRLRLSTAASAVEHSNTGTKPNFTELLWEKAPLFILVVVACLATMFASRSAGSMVTMESLPMSHRLANAVVSYVSYLGKTFWPSNLAVFYPHRVLPLWEVVMSALLLGGVTVWTIRRRREQPYLVVGWLWFLGTLVPAIQIVQTGSLAMADRYTYVPLIGIFIMLVWSAADFLAKGGWRRQWGTSVALAGVAACLILSSIHLKCWQNTVALAEHALKVTQRNYVAHTLLGHSFITEGRFNDGLRQYEEVSKLMGTSAEAHYDIGLALAGQGKFAEAVPHFGEAVRLRPAFTEARAGSGMALASLGRHEEALVQLEEVLRQRPTAVSHNNLANVLSLLNRHAEAVVHYRVALRLQPDWPAALDGLAWILATNPDDRLRNGAEALRLCERALAVSGQTSARRLQILAAAQSECGQLDRALKTAKAALEMASQSRNLELAGAIEKELASFRAGRPYRQ